MKRYRVFRDHAGRVHRVEMRADEVRATRLYWTGLAAICLLFLVAGTIASGVL